MAGEAEAARVGEALAVAEQEVGGRRERRQRLERRRDLAKRQQARDVGKAGRPARERALDQGEPGQPEHRDRGAGDPARLLEADVDAGDQAMLPKRSPCSTRSASLDLQIARRGRAQRPSRGGGPASAARAPLAREPDDAQGLRPEAEPLDLVEAEPAGIGGIAARAGARTPAPRR